MTSASTLARRARAEKNPKKAKALRAEAAQIRREEREAKAFQASTVSALDGRKKRKGNKIIKGLQQALEHTENLTVEGVNQVRNAMRAASVDHTPLHQMVNKEQPGKGEVVGGYLAVLAGEIAKLARKKGGIDEIQGRLMMLEAQTRHDAKFDVSKQLQKAAQVSNERWRDNIVTGFMARCEAMERVNQNGLPDAVVVDGVTLARVVDVLRAAGYTARGKR